MKNGIELAQNIHRDCMQKDHWFSGHDLDAQSAASESSVISTQTAKLVNHIFTELQVIFPAWRMAFPDKAALNNAKRIWTVALFENQIHHTRQIESGLRKARQSGNPHMPSVGQFIRWCLPTCEALGIPTAEQAFGLIGEFNHEVTRQQLPMVVRAAFYQIGLWNLSHLSQQKLFPIFQSHYEVLVRKVAMGENITQLCPMVLPKPENRAITPAERERRRRVGLSTIQQLKRQYFGGTHGH